MEMGLPPRRARLAAVICGGGVIAPPLAARPAARQPAAAPPRIAVCSLVTKAEVRKHLPWPAALDGIAAVKPRVIELARVYVTTLR